VVIGGCVEYCVSDRQDEKIGRNEMKLQIRKAMSISFIVIFATICIAIPAAAAEFEQSDAGLTVFEMPELDIQKTYVYNTTRDYFVPSRTGQEAVLYWGEKYGDDYLSRIDKLNGGEITNYGIDFENEDITLRKIYDWNGSVIFMDLEFEPESLFIDYPLWVGKTWDRDEVNFSGFVWMGFPNPVFVSASTYGYASIISEEYITVPAGTVHCLLLETIMYSQMGMNKQKIWLMENGFFAKRQLYHGEVFKEELVLKPVKARVDIKPETLNLHSKGKFTAFIELPYGFDVADIDLTTIECEGAQAIAGYVVDNKLIVKFNTQDIVDVATGNTALLTITGKFDDGILFEGFDAISVRVK